MKALEELTRLSQTPFESAVVEHKKEGKKVIGFFCPYVPEEIIYAAGMLPLRIRPAGCTDTGTADAYMSRLNCSFARSCLQFIAEGVYDFLDGLVFANSCDNVRRLYDILREKHTFPFMHFISVPHKAGGNSAVTWFKDELTHFKESLENSFGVRISDEALADAIDAAETGRFLEVMARALELELNELGSVSLKPRSPAAITSQCSVFAESEVVTLIAEGTELPDIVAAINKSIAGRLIPMVKEIRPRREYVLTGGVAKNDGVVKFLEDELGKILKIPVDPQIVGAVGAALIARERLDKIRNKG